MPSGGSKEFKLGLEALERWVYEIGERLGDALLQGAQSSFARAVPPHGQSQAGRGRPATTSRNVCAIKGCKKSALAKNLCAAHYRKARRLGLSEELSAENLRVLAEDRRKTRHRARS